LTASGDTTARVWDAVTGDLSFILSGHTGTVNAGMWSPDGSRIVTASWDGTAKVWDATTGTEIFTFSEHTADVEAVAWSPDGSRIVTASSDGTAKVWDATTGEEIITLLGHTAAVYRVDWSPSGDRIVTISADGTAKVWELDPSYLTITGGPGGGLAEIVDGFAQGDLLNWGQPEVAWSPQGDQVARGFLDGTTRVWDVATGEELFVLSYPEAPSIDVAWSPSGDRILTTYGDAGIKMWDAASGEPLSSYSQVSARRAEWSPDGTRIAAIPFFDKYVTILDADTGETLRLITCDKEWAWAVAWSPDGTKIVTSGSSGSARIWDADTGKLIWDLYPEVLGIIVSGVAWSPDGKFIATCTGYGSGSVWDASASSPTYGEELVTFSGHTGTAFVYWSRTGERILTASWDGTVRVWDISTALETGAKTGAELLRYPGSGAAWSPDETRIAIASMDGSLKVLPTWQTTQELIERAKECCVVRELTTEEREQFGLPSR
ncbi:MAG: hypothetical protein GY832_42820, partial [Chloroflexi bacterium]|nr:hypothetical protein [Chloroflexota bacterium]